MQMPPGVGKPACASRARLAALGPTWSESAAAASLSERMKRVIRLPFRPGRFALPLPECGGEVNLFYMIAVARQRIDDGDLFDREVGHNLDVLFVHDQHFLDAHAVTVFLAVLRFERKGHPFLDVDRV